MIPALDIYRAANLLVKRHAEDAPIHAAMRARSFETASEVRMNCVLGFLVSVVVGHVVVSVIYKWLGVAKQPKGQGVPSWAMGVGERIFFTLVVAFARDVSGTVVFSMMAWIGLKTVVGWNRPGLTGKDEMIDTRTQRAFVDLISMGFALVGGLICGGEILLYDPRLRLKF